MANNHGDCIGKPFPDVETVEIEDRSSFQLKKFANDKAIVLDFWTSKCERCPAALDHMQEMATNSKFTGKIAFFSVNLDSMDAAEEIINEHEWDDLTHLFLPRELKENLQTFLGMKTVPHHVIVKNDGTIVGNGKALEWSVLDELVASPGGASESTPAFVLDDDF